MSDETWIEVRLERIVHREKIDSQWVVLAEVEGARKFVIAIGTFEVLEITRVARGDSTMRPLTHQLLTNCVEQLGGKIDHVRVVNMRDNTYFAELHLLDDQGDVRVIDARPSDALALAMRASAPIRVAESVLEEVRTDKAGPDPLPE